MTRPYLLPGAAAVLLLPATLAAQTLPIPLENSSIAPQASPPVQPAAVPAAAPIPLPTPTPTIAPLPRATPTSRPTAPAPATATATASPTPRATSTPEAEAGTTPEPISTPAAPPTATPTAASSPRPTIETVVLPRQPDGPLDVSALWPWLAGGAVLLLVLAALLWRRRAEPEEAWPDGPAVETAAPMPAAATPERPAPSFFSPTPPLPAPVPAAAPARALDTGPSRLAVTLRPSRAGLNMMTATVEAEVIVANAGDAAATDIRANILLFGASHADEPDLARIAAAPVGRPAVPAFTLAGGADRAFRAVAALPLNAIVPLQAAGRPMFVPIVVVHLRWTDAAGERALAQAWAVGVERAGIDKLAPLWLDSGPCSYDQVAGRRHDASAVTQ